MFEWKRKQLENEQVKFFGGTQKGFISCYAKQVKPRIKIKLKPIKSSILVGLNPRYAIGSSQQMSHQQALAIANLQAQGVNYLSAGMGLAHNALAGGIGAASGGLGGNAAAWDVFGNKSPYL